MSNYIYNGMVTQPGFTTQTLTQFSSDEISSDEERATYNEHLDSLIDCSNMRTHRLPEDDEGMTEFNQIPSRMPQELLDALDGKTSKNPEGVSELVHVRLSKDLVAQLKAYGKTCDKGYQTLIEDILIEYSRNNSLDSYL